MPDPQHADHGVKAALRSHRVELAAKGRAREDADEVLGITQTLAEASFLVLPRI